MLDSDLYWLAGWLEGEGSFTFWRGARAKPLNRPSEHRNFRISAAAVDYDVVRRAAEILGCNVHGPYHSGNPEHQPYYKFALGNRQKVLEWCRRLRPLMGHRRKQQIDAVLQADQDFPPQPIGRPRA